MDSFAIEAPDIAAAWTRAVAKLDQIPDRRAFHTVVRISDPLRDSPETHTSLDRILEYLDLQPVETVANTIFPISLAASSRDHGHLVNRYMAMFENIKRLSPKNSWGTYFGRLVAYPSAPEGEAFDQIGAVISALIKEMAYPRGKAARYETTITCPTDIESAGPPQASTAAYSAPVQLPATDTGAMGTPCLSHISFQLDRRTGTVHALATYRSHYMIERAYGNYLGLGRLLGHVSSQSGVRPGTLTVVAGYAQIEPGTITLVRPLLSDTAPMFG